jgi:hypothetical protein
MATTEKDTSLAEETFDDYSAEIEVPSRTVLFLTKPRLGDALSDAETALDIAQADAKDTDDRELKRALKEAEEAVEAARAAVQAATKPFDFEAISAGDYEELKLKHPATPAQVKEAQRLGRMPNVLDENTFPPALIQRCCVKPRLTIDNAKEIWNDPKWSAAGAKSLFDAAVIVCNYRRLGELGKDSLSTLSSVKTSTIASREASRTPSS